MGSISVPVQIVVALGLLNVWLLRNKKATAYRGGSAQTLKDEFLTYGLPEWVYLVVGTLKIVSALALLVGIFEPRLVPLAASLVAVLMIGAIVMHIKVKDPIVKSVPAVAMLILSCSLLFLSRV